MEVCICIVSLWHGGTLNIHQAACPLVRLVKGEESWEASDHLQIFSLKIGVEPSQIVLSSAGCSKLQLTTGIHLSSMPR
ncbi:hypothetical protein TNCV_3442931 [Trichonephila clavipes]|nr:hypothetical protein TNCV_3442931 [Trichonephila clavipes]